MDASRFRGFRSRDLSERSRMFIDNQILFASCKRNLRNRIAGQMALTLSKTCKFVCWLLFGDARLTETRPRDTHPHEARNSIQNGSAHAATGSTTRVIPAQSRDTRPVCSHSSIAKRLLLWTLIVDVWIAWQPGSTHYGAILLLVIVHLGIMANLVFHEFALSAAFCKSSVILALSLVVPAGVTALTYHSHYLSLEYLGKKMLLKEYHMTQQICPHVYVMTFSLVVLTCLVRGLHRFM